MLAGIRLQYLLQPGEHQLGAVSLLNRVLLKRVHPIKRNKHDVTGQVNSIVAALHKTVLHVLIIQQCCVGWYLLEPITPKVTVVLSSIFGCGSTVVVISIVVTN